jgi:hypothetical protein
VRAMALDVKLRRAEEHVEARAANDGAQRAA